MDHLSSANLFSEMEIMDDAVFMNEWMGTNTLENFVQFTTPNNPLFPPSLSTENNGFNQTQNSDDVMMNNVQRQPSLSSSSNSLISFANSDENPKDPVMKMKMKTKTEANHVEPSGKTMIRFMPSQDCSDDQGNNLIRTIEFGAGKRGPTAITRSPLQAQDHVLAERKRRQKLTQRFIAISALVPGLKKLDKASVLGNAIKYIKELQERVKTLEADQEQTKTRNRESTVAVKRERISGNDNEDSSSLSDDGSYEAGTTVALPEIEVRGSGENLLIRVHCNKLRNHGAIITEIFREIERIHLTINTSHVMPFGNTTYITIAAQMNQEFISMEAKDVADNIRTTIVNLLCH